ncbi:MAG TPA: Glu/Leu/Phe/Val dehydrogenase dimerization domain-containing protein [Mycobacteriales bacterium]|nr:Glu/Leu/Phe/Val dehydrogenase dimerization domain-containing protein [Mycobacteriales bacterium]
MENVLRDWDGEYALTAYDEPSGAYMFIAVHSTRLGPAGGGTRMKTYARAEDGLLDACRLGEAMTLKMAVAGLPMGGGKSVLAVPGELDPQVRRDLLLHHARNIAALGGRYRTGPDMNTNSADMDTINEVTPYAFGRSVEKGGSGSSAPDTATGVFHGIVASVAHLDGAEDLTSKRVLVQGTGAVGEPLVEMLVKAGAHVIVSDVSLERVEALYDRLGVEVVAPASVLETECDVYAPCATGGVLDPTTIPRLRCRIVAGAANNPLSDRSDGELLREAGILYAPDFVINGGGAIHLIGYEQLGWTEEQVERGLIGIGTTLREIYRQADAAGISTEEAAERLARARLDAGPQPA